MKRLAQPHGADVYDASGRVRPLLDFSNTVAGTGQPAGWKRRLLGLLERCTRYPQPRSQGLARKLELALRLPKGSVLVGNGSSDCLDLAARSLAGEAVALEEPSFGGYGPKLERAGALVLRLGADSGPLPQPWALQKKALRGLASYWMANPGNPGGQMLGRAALLERIADCRRARVRILLDEAVAPQALSAPPELAREVVRRPGALLVRSLSKGIGLPGLRLGLIAGHPREIERLAGFHEPWSVNALAQAAGDWAFAQERRLAGRRRRLLAAWKRDLLGRLAPLEAAGRLQALESQTGYFLLQLLDPGADSGLLAFELERQGLLVRSCASYGEWGRAFLRLNPRPPGDNARLAAGLRRALEGR